MRSPCRRSCKELTGPTCSSADPSYTPSTCPICRCFDAFRCSVADSAAVSLTLCTLSQQFTSSLEAAFQPVATQAVLRNRNHLAFSAALFEYLARGLSSAVDVIEQHIFRLENSSAAGSAEHEEAWMMYVKLLYRHTNAGRGFKPGQLRDVTERAIKDFKNNSMFLATFYHNECE